MPGELRERSQISVKGDLPATHIWAGGKAATHRSQRDRKSQPLQLGKRVHNCTAATHVHTHSTRTP